MLLTAKLSLQVLDFHGNFLVHGMSKVISKQGIIPLGLSWRTNSSEKAHLS